MTLRTLNGSPIRRHRDDVGKLIGGKLYLHRNYISSDPGLLAACRAAFSVLLSSGKAFPFNCVRYDTKTGSVSFQEAPDFDTAREPMVGRYLTVDRAGRILEGYSKAIWHHKWLWVRDDYTGFDVEASKDWSRTWLARLPVPADGTNADRWVIQLAQYGME